MYSRKLLRAQISAERFLAKASGRNDPLEKYRKTEDYLLFQDTIADIIKAQIRWLRQNLANTKIFDNSDLADHQIEVILQTYLDRYMPRFKDQMTYEIVYNNFVAAFNASCKASYRRLGVQLLRKSAISGNLIKADRPDHQKELEEAHNAGDYNKVTQILDSMPDDDPYKASMESVFGSDRALAAAADTGYNSTTNDYTVNFDLTNQDYLDALNNDANYLLNTKSTAYDQTTKDRLVNIVKAGRLNNDTIDEVSSDLNAQVDSISSVRSFMIANTETANAFGTANQAFLTENQIPEKEWIIAGPHNLVDICDDNADASPIAATDSFPSGDMAEPAHTSCECYTNGVGLDLTTMSEDDLNSLILWDGS